MSTLVMDDVRVDFPRSTVTRKHDLSCESEQPERIPSSLARGTFPFAKLDWAPGGGEVNVKSIDCYKRILGVRKRSVVPYLDRTGPYARSFHVLGKGAVRGCWMINTGRVLPLIARLFAKSVGVLSDLDGDLLWIEAAGPEAKTMRPRSVRWRLCTEVRQ